MLIFYFITLHFHRMPRAIFVRHLMAQILVAAVLLVTVRIVFANNEGEGFEFHLWDNLRFWLRPESYWRFTNLFGPMTRIPYFTNVIMLMLAAWLVCHNWNSKPEEIRRVLVLSAVTTIPLFLCGGFRDEVRALSLLFPPGYLLAVHTLSQIDQRA